MKAEEIGWKSYLEGGRAVAGLFLIILNPSGCERKQPINTQHLGRVGEP